MQSLTKLCPACGVEVEVICMTIGSGVDAAEKERCAMCGFVFGAEGGDQGGDVLFERMAIAEDFGAVRAAVRAALLDGRMARTVDEYPDGAQLVSAFGSSPDRRPRYQALILDLQMPVLDGLKTAAVLRAMEKQRGWLPTPFLFFSGMVCDPRFRQHLVALGPGWYLNKASIQERQDLGDRLRAVLLWMKQQVAVVPHASW